MSASGPLQPYTDARSVAANQDFRQYGADARFTPAVFATPTLTSYFLKVTPVLPAGIYQLRVKLFATGSSAGTDISLTIDIDGFQLDPILSEASIIEGGYLIAGIPDQDWTAGAQTHAIDFLVAQPGGPGSVTARTAFLSWERKI